MILKEVKVVCFDILLQVFILKGLTGVAWPAFFFGVAQEEKAVVWLPQPIKREVTRKNVTSVANIMSSGKWVSGQFPITRASSTG